LIKTLLTQRLNQIELLEEAALIKSEQIKKVVKNDILIKKVGNGSLFH